MCVCLLCRKLLLISSATVIVRAVGAIWWNPFMVKGMSLVVNVMLSLMSVMSPPPALCNLSARTVVKLCSLGVFSLGVSLIPEM